MLKQDNKGSKEIKIPISSTVEKVLTSYKKKSGYVFINPDTGKPYTTIKKGFSHALEKAGITDFRFHDLRRTFGTWLLTSGVDIRTIQNLLAHSDISTTERYLSIVKEQDKKVVDILDNYMS